MKMSYAQNLEDYHLDLIFAGQADGTYLDVGGGPRLIRWPKLAGSVEEGSGWTYDGA